MRLIGMLDSPYVRRVAISLKLIGLPFTHESVSVFGGFEAFAAINPVVKAPTLVVDEGTVLMDSTLILEWIERLAPADKSLVPSDPAEFLRAQRIVGLSLAACEKSVQMVYELKLRPAEKRHQPWLDRVRQQLLAAYRLLEAEIVPDGVWCFGPRPLQADVTTAVAWHFTQDLLSDVVPAADHPTLVALSAKAEALAEFRGSRLEV